MSKLSSLKVRKVVKDDVRTIFNWRNMDDLVSLSKLKKKVTIKEHENWFYNKILDNECLMLIIELGDTEIGLIRFDKHDTECEVSIYLVPGYEGKGYGSIAFKIANEQANNICDRLVAKVQKENSASKKFFEKLGFSIIGYEDGMIVYTQ